MTPRRRATPAQRAFDLSPAPHRAAPGRYRGRRFPSHAAGDAVDGSRENLAYADCATVSDEPLDFTLASTASAISSRGEKCIVPIRHQHGSSVAALAFDGNRKAGGCGDGSDHADEA